MKGDGLEHSVTEQEAVRSVLVQGLPLFEQELTESVIMEAFYAYGEISEVLLETDEESTSQRAVLVFKESAGATAALQANGLDILGASCSVSLTSSMPTLNDGPDRDIVSDKPVAGEFAGMKGDDLDHWVTEQEAARSVLVQGLPLFEQELTESVILEAFYACGEISEVLLQTDEESSTQRAVLVFKESAGATAALQANGLDILGANCRVSLASSMPTLNDGLDRDNVSDQPAAGGDTRRGEAVAMTIMIVGKSGSGKSTLGNQLLNAELGPDDDYVQYFEEHGGTAGQTTETTSHTSADGRVRVIDTPGIPDPDKRNTAMYFDTIVKKIRAVEAVNLLVFMVKEDRTDEKQFSDYRVLLKQFNYIPWNKLMVCRQPDYAHMPSRKAKQKKQHEGAAFVSDILEKSGMDMPFSLHLDGTSEAAGVSLGGIVDHARKSACVSLGDGPSLQTVEERRTFVRRLLSSKERASALKEEISRHDNAIGSHNRWAKAYEFSAIAALPFLYYTGGILPLILFYKGGVNEERIEKMQAEKEKAMEELRSEEVDEDLLREAKEELDELNSLCGGGASSPSTDEDLLREVKEEMEELDRLREVGGPSTA